MEDYQSAAAKLQQFGIKLDDPEDKSKQASVQLVMLGSKEALSVIGVSALPTVFGSVDSKECLRYVGDQVLSSLNLADPATLTSFLKLFDKSSDDKSADDTSKKKADKSGGSKTKKGKGGASAGKAAGSLKVDLISASRATAILNGEVFPFSLSSTPIKHRSSGCSCRLH
jgi:hypothetical protein